MFYFLLISGKNERLNAISRDFSEWMVYLCIKHKLEECVWSLSVQNFTLFTHLPFRDFSECTVEEHKALSSRRRTPQGPVGKIPEFH